MDLAARGADPVDLGSGHVERAAPLPVDAPLVEGGLMAAVVSLAAASEDGAGKRHPVLGDVRDRTRRFVRSGRRLFSRDPGTDEQDERQNRRSHSLLQAW